MAAEKQPGAATADAAAEAAAAAAEAGNSRSSERNESSERPEEPRQRGAGEEGTRTRSNARQHLSEAVGEHMTVPAIDPSSVELRDYRLYNEFT